jgi:hypothetical protein
MSGVLHTKLLVGGLTAVAAAISVPGGGDAVAAEQNRAVLGGGHRRSGEEDLRSVLGGVDLGGRAPPAG